MLSPFLGWAGGSRCWHRLEPIQPQLVPPDQNEMENPAALALTTHHMGAGDGSAAASSPDLYFPLLDPGECRLCLKLHKMN